MEGQRYRHSGKLGRSLLPLPIVSVLVCAIISYIGVEVSMWIPYMKLLIVVSMLLGAAAGAAIGWVSQQLRCRSPLYVWLCALIATAVSAQVVIASFDYAIIRGSPGSTITLTQLLFDPAKSWQLLVNISQAGLFQKNNRPMSSTDLWVDWGFQAICYFPAIPVAARLVYRKKIFCEPCLRWLDLGKDTVRFPIPTDKQVLERLTKGDLNALAELTAVKGTYLSYIRLDFIVCPGCGNTGTYQITRVDGEKQEKALSAKMLLTPEAAAVLATVLAKKDAAAPATLAT